MVDITIAGVGAVPLVLALVELAKRQFPQFAQYAPFAAIVLGIGVVGVAQGFTVESATAGLVVGLAASGLWSGGKKIGAVLKK